MMKIKDQIADDIKEFCKISGISESRFGMEVAHSHKLLNRVRDGAITVTTMQKIYDFIEARK